MEEEKRTFRIVWALIAMLAAMMALALWQGGSSSARTESGLGKGYEPLFTPSPTQTSTPTNTPACGLAWRGTGVPQPQADQAQFLGIDGASASDVWAVGYSVGPGPGQSLIEHWDGSQWSIIPSPNGPSGASFLQDVAVVESNDVWAVGYWGTFSSTGQTLVLHWNGSAWSIVPSPNASPNLNLLRGLTVVAEDDIWAVGYSGQENDYDTLTLHWNGSAWSIVAAPSPGVYQNILNDVTALGPNDVWAVGSWSDSYQNGFSALVLRWNGSGWSIASAPTSPMFTSLGSVSALAANDVWAVSDYAVFHWNGSQWSNVPGPPIPNRLQDVAAIAPDDVWIVGYSSYISHWNGSNLSAVQNVSGNYPQAVSATGQDVWAVGFDFGVNASALRFNDPCAGPTHTATPTATGTPPTSTSTATLTPTHPSSTATVTPTPTAQCASWVEKAPLPRGVMGSSAAASGGYLYSFGGRDFTYNNIATTSRYDPASDNWTALAAMPAPRNWAGAAAVGGYIYVVNGSEGAGPLDTLFRYDIASNSWMVLPPTLGATYGPAVVALNGDVYRIGGLDDAGVFTTSVEILGQGFVAPMPVGRAWASAAALNGYIYVAGGSGDARGGYSNKTFRYDPSTDMWSDVAIADLPEAKAFSAAGALNGRFVVAGGGDSYSSVWAWDPQTDTWESLPPLLYPRFNMPGVVVGKVMHVLGGINDNLPTDTHQQYDALGCGAPTPSPTPSLDLRSDVYATVESCTSVVFHLKVYTDPPGAHVPVTTTMRLYMLMPGGYEDFVVPPFTGSYSLDCTTGPCRPGGVEYTITADLNNDVQERDETNNSYTWSHIFGPLCTPTPVLPTPCALAFTDVPPSHTFYPYVRCLACRGIIEGYSSGCETGNPCFRPQNNVTRGQIAKIVANAGGFTEPVSGQSFEDVPPDSTFYTFTQRLANRGVMQGYACGNPEPCVFPWNRPYFRPGNNATRGQLSKIVSQAAGFTETVTTRTFQDVLPTSTFYKFIERLASREIMSGYPCGSPEPCVPPADMPYFRPGNNVTRGQTAKIVANTFFPNCNTPFR